MCKLVPTVVVFLGGFSVMVLEIVGARFLGKYFGSSLYVWTSQIGVVMIALALGYFFGGWMADRLPRLRFLGLMLLPAAGATMFLPEYADKVVDAIVMRHPPEKPIPLIWEKLDPAIGSAAIFLIPCVGLAAISPFLIRVCSPGLSHVGRVSGWIIAGSTVGSIVGVFVSGYILIEIMSLTQIFRLTGLLVLGIGILCFMADGLFANRERQNTITQTTPMKSIVQSMILVLALVGSQRAYSGPPITVYEQFTAYHYIRVVDQDGLRTLYFDNAPQTRMSLFDPTAGHFGYTDLFHLARLWNDQLKSVLMIGLGGASTQRSFERFDPELQIHSVEIDPQVVHVATRFFHFRTNQSQVVHISDGRVFLKKSTNYFDLIIVDAYTASRYGASIPVHLATREFFAIAADRLNTNGILAYNVIGTIDGWQRNLVASMYMTLKSVFPQVYMVPAEDSMNVVFFAIKGTNVIVQSELLRRGNELQKTNRIPPRLSKFIPQIRFVPPPWFSQAIVLTDNYAPVEGLTRMNY